MVGETVSHYLIIEKLGGGGMGVVYKAMDVRLNRLVALKFLSPELTRDTDANQRFRLEAQAASALDHPNICTIHEVDETADHRLFLALAFYDGETLKKRIERGPLPIDAALDLAVQTAQGLSRAHQTGILHRDIKPANIMVTSEGLVKIVDFGLAKLTGDVDLTRTGTTLGTVAYMAPEQARGMVADARADVWALGVVLYEMLAGVRPFTGQNDAAVLSSILTTTPASIGRAREGVPADLQRIVSRAMDQKAANRYATATEMLADLVACQKSMATVPAKSADVLRWLRRPIVAIPAAAIIVAAAIPAALSVRQNARVRQAREEGIPQIVRLLEADDVAGAFALATETERLLPDDPILASLWPQFSVAGGGIVSKPDGAEVFVQPYTSGDGPWTSLGRTPIANLRLPRSVFRFRIEKEGYEPRLLAARNPSNLLGNAGGGPGGTPGRGAPIEIRLVPKGGSDTNVVQVPGGRFPVGLTAFNSELPVDIGSFAIDRFEVSNKDFKPFVDKGGYEEARNWKDLPLPKEVGAGGWREVARTFVDSTGRPGPAAWELGAYPTSQADVPVTGVSWYEAAAYCQSVGKTLPTLYHWARAALSSVEIGSPLAPSIIPLSNFAGKGLAAAGTYHGLGPYGTFDMAGNAREWVWNETADGRRWILGGGWSDPDYLFTTPTSLPPTDRSALNGFRCARYDDPSAVSSTLVARLESSTRDNRAAKAVSDEIYAVFARQYEYVKSPLNSRVEATDTSQPDWVRDTISFDAGYENGRMNMYLFLPKNAAPPYQPVVFFPGVGVFAGAGPSTTAQPGQWDFIVKSGRAAVFPVYKGSFERWDSFLFLRGDEYLRTFRTRMFQWRQDLGRVIDVLAARKDIDAGHLAYYGTSFGASTALPIVALEPRIKVSVLAPAGFTYRDLPPEADAINYVSRITMPVLMLGGRHDYIFPMETSQKPLFERIGTPAKDKRHVVFDAGHGSFPRSEMVREVLGWLDRYLGPSRRPGPTQ